MEDLPPQMHLVLSLADDVLLAQSQDMEFYQPIS